MINCCKNKSFVVYKQILLSDKFCVIENTVYLI